MLARPATSRYTVGSRSTTSSGIFPIACVEQRASRRSVLGPDLDHAAAHDAHSPSDEEHLLRSGDRLQSLGCAEAEEVRLVDESVTFSLPPELKRDVESMRT